MLSMYFYRRLGMPAHNWFVNGFRKLDCRLKQWEVRKSIQKAVKPIEIMGCPFHPINFACPVLLAVILFYEKKAV